MEACSSCYGMCCETFNVPVTDSDLRRLMECGVDVSDCVGFISICEMSSSYPDVRLDDGYYHMVLERLGGACVLAIRAGGGLRCGVHGHHHLACQLYPINAVTGKPKKGHICHFKGFDGVDHAGLGERNVREVRGYGRKVRAWNQTRGEHTVEGFLKHLLE
ncbi:MAG: hypothetical protein GF416_04435 [Candidatus Altiarchaeales archaeon]|nr:hypothetical protein [Candidatus Altiarchaeales archaeon]MBD3416368.1 hypothetical protein [Candidatus Altiarchaeales archaeon]